MSVPTVVCDTEPHIFKFLDAEDVRNPFLVDPTLNGTKITSLIVGGTGPCIEIIKHPDVTLTNFCEELFIVNLIVHGAVVQVNPGGVQFFTQISLLVHLNIDSVI